VRSQKAAYMSHLSNANSLVATQAVLRDTIQPFPTFSEIFVQVLHDLRAAVRKPVGAQSTLYKGVTP